MGINDQFLALLVVYSILFTTSVSSKSQHYNITESTWDNQFAKGKWDYLGKVAIERARNSVISGVFALAFAPKGRILDVGCGEGVLSDYLNEDQKKLYLGVDLSHEAIRIAKKKRGTLNFLQADAKLYVPPPGQQYDVIIFNEMIYYMDHLAILKQYSSSRYLSKDGIIVVCVWYTNKVDFLRSSIFADARKELDSIDMVEVSGVTGAPSKPKSPISFHIEAFRLRA